MDLSTLTVVELRDLQQQIPAELKRREAQDKMKILNEARAFVKARGYALEDLLGKEAKVKGRPWPPAEMGCRMAGCRRPSR